MKEYIYQNISWLQLFWFLFKNMVFINPIMGIYNTIMMDQETANYYFKETVESYYWLKIHCTYKSKRIG